MKKLLLFAAVFPCSMPANATVKVPYFEELSENEVCGSNRCQPSFGPRYTFFRNPIDYNGEPESFLGRKYKSIFNTSPCAPTPQKGDVEWFGKTSISGKATSNTISTLSGKVKSDVGAVIGRIVASLAPSLKANASALVDNTITNASVQNLNLEYQKVTLKQRFWDQHSAACKAAMKNNDMVIGGIAVVRVSGDWTKSRISDILNKLEADASFSSLVSGDAKASYDAEKTKVLAGSFEPTSFVIAASWFKKSDIS